MKAVDDRFHSVDSVLSDLHASALSELATLNIEAHDRSDRIGVRGDYPFVSIEYRSSSSLRPPKIAMVTTRLGYSYPTEASNHPMIEFETVAEIFQTGCESRDRKLTSATFSLDNVCERGLATIVAQQIAEGHASVDANN